MTRSYIKLYGPPIMKGLRSLEKVAVEMGEKTEMRFYGISLPPVGFGDIIVDPQSLLPDLPLTDLEKIKLISRSSQLLGDYDFFFEWGKEPTVDQVNELIDRIDKALADCGCHYSITTK